MDEVEKLIKDLKSEDAKVRSDAAWMLGKIGDASVVPALVEALGDEDKNVGFRATDALAYIGASAVPALVEALAGVDATVRKNAALALGLIGSITLPHLVKALGDKDANVVKFAALALGEIGSASAIPALVKALEGNDDGGVKLEIAEALAKMGEALAVSALVEVLGDEDADVRRRAAAALGTAIKKVDSVEGVEEIEVMVQQGCDALTTKHPDTKVEALMEISKLMIKLSEKKNSLSSKKDLLLDDKPKPPKKGDMYQAARRVRNG